MAFDKVIEELKQYTDTAGLLVTETGDGGDSLHRESMYLIALKLYGKDINDKDPLNPEYTIKDRINKIIDLMSDKNGNWRRSFHQHQYYSRWYSNWDRLSRDQAVALVSALAIWGEYLQLFLFFKQHLFGSFNFKGLTLPRLGLFTTNTKKNHQYPTKELHEQYSTPDVEWDYEDKIPDITGPELYAAAIRCNFILAVIFLPILLLGDAETFIGSIIKINKPEDKIHNNHILILLLGNYRIKTFLSILAKDVYVAKINPQKMLDHYFRDETGQPPLNKLYKQIIKERLC